MYIKITGGVPEKYSVEKLRADNPNTSFPAEMSNESLASWNVFPAVLTDAPTVDHTKNLTDQFSLVDGQWTQVWTVSDASSAEIAERTEQKAAEVRDQRNVRLSDTDWTQVADAPVDKSAWAAYRQSLRDISKQTGFPWEITWPEKPV